MNNILFKELTKFESVITIPDVFLKTDNISNDDISPNSGQLAVDNNIGVLYPFTFGVVPANVDFDFSCTCSTFFTDPVYTSHTLERSGGLGLVPVGSPLTLYASKFHRVSLGGSRSRVMANNVQILDVVGHIFKYARIVRKNGYLFFYTLKESMSTESWVLHYKSLLVHNESFNLMLYSYLRGGVENVELKVFL